MKTQVWGPMVQKCVQIAKIKYPNIRLNRLETLGPVLGAAAGRSRGSRGKKRYGNAIRPIFCIVKICWAKKISQKKSGSKI